MQILTSGILNDTVVYEQPGGGASISSQHLNFRPTVAGERETNFYNPRNMYSLYSDVLSNATLLFSLESNVSDFTTYSVNFPFPWDLVVGGMTFSHMDIGELINLGPPPPPPPTTPNRGSPTGRPFITYSYSLKCAVCCTEMICLWSTVTSIRNV